jgi:hypothetical protein
MRSPKDQRPERDQHEPDADRKPRDRVEPNPIRDPERIDDSAQNPPPAAKPGSRQRRKPFVL